MEKVSVIVPVYKVEKYIRRCVDSIVLQTYKNIEVILVDDGSPDQCGDICDDYANKYSNIKVIHQENRGQAAARNTGVANATGEYIMFVDADDFILPDCIEYLVIIKEKADADVSIGGFKYWYENGDFNLKKNNNYNGNDTCILTSDEALIAMNYTKGFGATAWAKLYSKHVIEIHPFPEGQIYEDLAILYKIINDCKNVVYGKKIVYVWVQRAESTMHSTFNQRQMAGIEATLAQIRFFSEKNPLVVHSAKVRHMAKIAELMSIALISDNSREWYKTLKSHMYFYNEVMNDSNVNKSLKIRLFSIKCGYLQAKIIFTIHERCKRFIFRKFI